MAASVARTVIDTLILASSCRVSRLSLMSGRYADIRYARPG